MLSPMTGTDPTLRMSKTLAALALFLLTTFLLTAAGTAVGSETPTSTIRLALFNIRELSSDKIADVDRSGIGRDPQLRAAAAIIRQIRPDILVVNEIDHRLESGEHGLEWNARRFAEAYLATGPGSIGFPFSFAAANNTGRLTGIDFDGDGHISTPSDRGARTFGNDCFGYGSYPGQYSMAVLSQLPLDSSAARTFQTFLWRDLPGHHMPVGFFSDEAAAIFRLSSKSHWDLPIEVDGSILHLLLSHPTPPGFDGEEDKNGRRNFDEIKFWARYLDDEPALYDDEGRRGGHGTDAPFVVMGDLNANPNSSGQLYDGQTAISQLLEHPRVQDSGKYLTSAGALAVAGSGAMPGPPDHKERSTSGFRSGMRIDYILPSIDTTILDGGVYWPDPVADPEGAARAELASDHRLVWLDLEVSTVQAPDPADSDSFAGPNESGPSKQPVDFRPLSSYSEQ